MEEQKTFLLKGVIIWSKSSTELSVLDPGWLVCEDGLCAGAFSEIPEEYRLAPVIDCGTDLIVPGMTDLHLHAPQYGFCGLGMDKELIDWLAAYTFPEEAKYADLAYAEKGYEIFVRSLRRSATTRAGIFATAHTDATLLLMEKLEASGLRTMVGRVNMDRNADDIIRERDAAYSEAETRRFLAAAEERFTRTKPILTPRFIPSCTDDLMERLSALQKETGLPVQSHLSENPGEIAWVKELCPWSSCYGDAYAHFDLFGGDGCPTIMAHCVYSGEEETALMKERGVFVAHCPQSNTNIASGIAPVRRYLDEGLFVGLGSDVAGGSSLDLFRAIVDTIQVSKLRWRLQDESLSPLSAAEAFYLATAGGGAFFGKVGKFEPGYEFDALVLDDTSLPSPRTLSASDRLERFCYLGGSGLIRKKFVSGQEISLL